MLTTKVSIDAHRQTAVWELSVALHQSEPKAAASIKEAKASCSQVTLDANATFSWLTLEPKTICSGAILEANTTCSMAVKKAKTTRGHMVQEAEAICSKAISEVEAHRVFQAELLQREHGSIMQGLEGQVIQEESRSQANFLSTCQVILYNSPPDRKSALATSYHILLGQKPPLPPLAPQQRTSPWKNSQPWLLPPHQCPNSLIGPKDGTLHQILLRACLWAEPLRRLLWGTPQPQEARDPSLVQNTQSKPC